MKDKKARIIEAALVLFGRKGFSKVSIKEIAQQAGVSQVTIYNHFENKEVLVEKIVQGLMDKVMAAAEQIYSSELPYEEKLLKAFEVCNSETAQAVEHYFTPESLADPKLLALIFQAVNTRKEEIYVKFIDLGYALRAIPAAIDKQSILFLLQSLNVNGLTIDEEQDREKLSQDLIYLFLYGIIGKEKGSLEDLNGEEVLQLLTAQVRSELEKGGEI